MGRSWLISGAGLDAGLVRAVGVVLMVVVLASLLLSALSTLGFVVPAGWWAGLIVGSAVGSSILLGLFFSPTLLLGFAINIALVSLVVASVWSPVASAIPR
jgi:hypothetical protein